MLSAHEISTTLFAIVVIVFLFAEWVAVRMLPRETDDSDDSEHPPRCVHCGVILFVEDVTETSSEFIDITSVGTCPACGLFYEVSRERPATSQESRDKSQEPERKAGHDSDQNHHRLDRAYFSQRAGRIAG